jgi:hypothetical protein
MSIPPLSLSKRRLTGYDTKNRNKNYKHTDYKNKKYKNKNQENTTQHTPPWFRPRQA